MHLGALSAALAFVWWGLFPLYFRIVPGIAAGQVLAHRIVWCLLFLAAVLSVRRQWAWLPQVVRKPKVLAAFTASALLIAANWLTYIWSVGNDHVIDASLGYFITPLFNVLLGYTLLHERPRRVQWVGTRRSPRSVSRGSRCRPASCRGSRWCWASPLRATGCCARSPHSGRSKG